MIQLANATTDKVIEENQVKVCNYYDKGWDYIIRPPSKIANGLAFYAKKLCENNNVLYSQEKRLTLNNLLKKNNYDINYIKEKVYCDCSSFVGTCINGIGILIDVSTFNTQTMKGELEKKDFTIIKFKKQEIQAGDILLAEKRHTVIVIKSDNATDSKMETLENKGCVYLKDKNSYLNIREKPSTDSKIIGTLKQNEILEIISEVNEWYQIEKDNKQGYCNKKYVKLL